MELLKSKSIIALVVMILGVSYYTALDNSITQNHTQENENTISINA